MKRYYLLMNKNIRNEGVRGDPYFVTEWSVVPTRGEHIGDNCFYQTRKWCGKVMYFLYDAPTGVYICRKQTLDELKEYVYSDDFQNQLDNVRKSDFYKLMLRTFDKAMKEYVERVKGGKKNENR